MRQTTDSKFDGGLWFAGTQYPDNDESSILMMQIALKLAPCRYGNPCDLDSTLMISCISGNPCADSHEAYLKQVYVERGGMSEAKFAQAISLTDKLREAVVNQDVHAFIR